MKKLIDKLKSAMSWIAEDGFQHIAVCAIIVFAFGWIRPLYVAPIIALAIGISKELYDKYTGHGVASWHDVICDCIGIIVGMLLVGLYLIAI